MSKKIRTIELRDYLNDILEMIADIEEFAKNLTFEELKKAAIKEIKKEFSD